ncbi:MAG: hypothetical protein SFY32_08935 [Bacteroidota bacterium]|nr:hypothetical protein [Bacteroidota bacterium]
MKYLILIVCVIFIGFSHAEKSKDIQKTVTTGIYVTSIYDLNLEQHYFGVEFWQWFVYRKEYKNKYNYNPINSVHLLDVYNSEYNEEYLKIDTSLKNDIYVLRKISAKVRNDFDVNDFPFDKQVLKLRFEDAESELKKLKFNIEETAFSKPGIDTDIKIDGIIIKSEFNTAHETHQYQNNFGNPKNLQNKDVFDRIVATINIRREVGFLFLKLFTGLYVSLLISLLSFLISPRDINTRFSLPVGGLFAAVSNKYFVDGLLPKVNSMTFSDLIHSFTFVSIFLIIFSSVINIYFLPSEPVHEKYKIRPNDLKAFIIILSFYIIVNLFFILKAILG